MNRLVVCCAIALSTLFVAAATWAESPPELYRDAKQPIEKRVEDLLSRLTLEEKVALCHANSIFATAACRTAGRAAVDDG